MENSQDEEPEIENTDRTIEEVNEEVNHLVKEAEQLLQTLLKEGAN